VLGASHPSAGGVDDSFSSANGAPGNPLLSKQAVIVLREELEFFAIPPRKARAGEAKGDEEKSALELRALKARCGEALISRRSIFTALQRNVSKENNMAEQHLIDMLCMSGFERDDSWGFRAVEPSRCCITSIALVLLKTGISVKDDGGEIAIDQQQLATAQKLLLFWRKPAVSGAAANVRCSSARRTAHLRRHPPATCTLGRALTRLAHHSASAGGTASMSCCPSPRRQPQPARRRRPPPCCPRCPPPRPSCSRTARARWCACGRGASGPSSSVW
jgi:hypothetical protein